jgi:hypothetical protein
MGSIVILLQVTFTLAGPGSDVPVESAKHRSSLVNTEDIMWSVPLTRRYSSYNMNLRSRCAPTVVAQ